MQIAIQEDMLIGRTPLEKFERAAALGLQGVEVWARDLAQRLPEIVDAMLKTGVAVSAVHFGRLGRLLDPHPIERERALNDLRQTIMDSSDLGAQTVILVPHYYSLNLPDLTPFMSADQMARELFHAHMRTVGDYANAMGVSLLVTSLNRYESPLTPNVSVAAGMAGRVNSPAMGIAVGTYHMALEEGDIPGTLKTYANQIRYVHLADSNRELPGRGALLWGSVARGLKESGYNGWLSLECGSPGDNQPHAEAYAGQLPAALDVLRINGLIDA